MRNRSTGRLAQRLGLAAVAILVSLILTEWLCRILVPSRPSIRFQQDVNELEGLQLHAATRIIQDDPELFWTLTPNTRLPADAWPFFGRIANGQSLREAHEIPPAKRRGEIRILFLGDSCTFGYGVAHDQAFPHLVESALRTRYPGVPLECINAGVPGYSLFQGWRYLETEGLRYEPDLVVLNFGWNDYAHWDDRGDRDHDEAARASRPPPLLRRSRLCQLLWAAAHPAAPSGATRRPRVLPDEFAALLQTVKRTSVVRKVEILALVWPMRGNTEPATPPEMRTELQEKILSFGQQRPMSVPPAAGSALDLVPLARDLVETHGVAAVYFDNGHVTPLAHQAISRAIVEKIEPWVAEKVGQLKQSVPEAR